MAHEFAFDTSAFVDPWRRHHPPDVVFFKSMWKKIDELIDSSAIVACDEVKKELERKDDEILRYVKAKKGLFVPTSEAQEKMKRAIIAKFPRWVPLNSTKNQADPFVVALGHELKLTVVTYEGNGNLGNLRIPYVCKDFGVNCIHFVEFLRRIGV